MGKRSVGDYSPDDYEEKIEGKSIADIQWYLSCQGAEIAYKILLGKGWTPQQARSVLPNSLKTEIVMTANPREWRHIFGLRTSKSAYPQMREIILSLLQEFQRRIPILFDDIGREERG